MTKLPIPTIQKAVLGWYAAHGRHDLPWRNLEKLGYDVPYGVIVSEFMLQQTQVERVELKFRAFMKTFPTITKLAHARPAKVITLWSGLGYNRRAVALQKAAQAIVAHHGGQVPSDPVVLETLPGIGPYTAGAIAAFAFNHSVPVLDTNIERFYELLFWGYHKPKLDEQRQTALSFVPDNQSCLWHSSLMDLMSKIRTLKTPLQQQQQLLLELNLKPTWRLPKLTNEPLKRTKQSVFHRSQRYYRGRLVAFLKEQPKHQATLQQLNDLMKQLDMPAEYNLQELLAKLKQDGLIVYPQRLTAASRIHLP